MHVCARSQVSLSVNTLDDDGICPLYLALKQGNTAMAEKLLSFGANVDLAVGSGAAERLPMLHYAVQERCFPAAHFLIDHGCQVSEAPPPLVLRICA